MEQGSINLSCGIEKELDSDDLFLISLALRDFNWCNLVCSLDREAYYRDKIDAFLSFLSVADVI